MNVKEIREILKARAGVDLEGTTSEREQGSAIFGNTDQILKVAQALSSAPGVELTWLEAILCGRHSHRGTGFWRLTYVLRSVAHERTLLGSGLNLIVDVPEDLEGGFVPSVVSVWPMAQWMEREAALWSGLEFRQETR